MPLSRDRERRKAQLIKSISFRAVFKNNIYIYVLLVLVVVVIVVVAALLLVRMTAVATPPPIHPSTNKAMKPVNTLHLVLYPAARVARLEKLSMTHYL